MGSLFKSKHGISMNLSQPDGVIEVQAVEVKPKYTWAELAILMNSNDPHRRRMILDTQYAMQAQKVQPGLPKEFADPEVMEDAEYVARKTR